jgi:hypothetical protein
VRGLLSSFRRSTRSERALACGFLLALFGCHAESAGRPRLRCTTSYAGEERTHDIAPTHAPYRVEPLAIGKRFLFKAVYVDDPAEVERVALYVYTQEDPPKILQEVTFRPPYPRSDSSARYGFTGLEHVYSDTARELMYWCALAPAGSRE